MPSGKKICFDRILPNELMAPHPGQMFSLAAGPARAAFFVAKLWPNGSTIRIRFMNGTPQQQATVQQQATQWLQFVNLRFDFTGDQNAPIRIAFDDVGSWSMIGTDALSISANQPTMNFAWLDDGVVHHEFGHLLGMIHEHQNPINNPIQWNKPVVIQDLSGPPNNWDLAKIQHNMFDKYDISQINGSNFDPQSVMLYSFPASWTLNGFHTNYNTAISALDQQWARLCYPPSTTREDQYLVGDWNGDGKDELAVRRGNRILFQNKISDTVAGNSVIYGNGNSEDQYLVGDWTGDGRDKLAVRRGNKIFYQGKLSDAVAAGTISYGNGNSEHQYLVGDWTGDGRDKFAVRRGNQILYQNALGNSSAAGTVSFGNGNSEDQYMAGDWTGDGKSKLAVRRANKIFYQNKLTDAAAAGTISYGNGNTENQYLVGCFVFPKRKVLAVRRRNTVLYQGNLSDGSAAGTSSYGNG